MNRKVFSIKKIMLLCEEVPECIKTIEIKLFDESLEQEMDDTFVNEDDDPTIFRAAFMYDSENYVTVRKALREMALKFYDRNFIVNVLGKNGSTNSIMDHEKHKSVKDRMSEVCGLDQKYIYEERIYCNSMIVTCTFNVPIQGINPEIVSKTNLFVTMVNGTRQFYFLQRYIDNLKISSFNYYLQLECPNLSNNPARFRIATDMLLTITNRVLQKCEKDVKYLNGVPYATEAEEECDNWVNNTEMRLVLAAERLFNKIQKERPHNSTI